MDLLFTLNKLFLKILVGLRRPLRRPRSPFLVFACLLFAYSHVYGIGEEDKSPVKNKKNKPISNLFKSEDVLNFKLIAPFKTISDERSMGKPPADFDLPILPMLDEKGDKDKNKEKEYKGIIQLPNGVKIPVMITTRGSTSLGQCKFPKLSIKIIDKSLAKGTPFEKAKKFKLGTHCEPQVGFKDDISKFQRLGTKDAVYRERFAYKIFDTVSPVAFKTRKSMVTYQDADAKEGEKQAETYPAFILESAGELQSRISKELNDEVPVTDKSMSRPSEFDETQEEIDVLFKKLIGNGDWSFGSRSGSGVSSYGPAWNQKIYSLSNGTCLPVPYDFDVCGTVCAELYSDDFKKAMSKLFQMKDLTPKIFQEEFNKIRQKYPDDVKGRKVEAYIKNARNTRTAVDSQLEHIVLDFLLIDNARFAETINKHFIDASENPALIETIKRFQDRKSQIYKELENSDLDKQGQKVFKERLDTFYKQLDTVKLK
ncbi:MAG: hypothetical protein HQK51_06015 [Oligoflexia bacterium]|nr:hypothetical protein [Oligoflexia bacterium]